MKKKLIASILAVSMMATLAVGMTLAYFTATKTAPGTFTVGNVQIKLNQTHQEETSKVYAGEVLAKNPAVENSGDNPCFVRIKVDGLRVFVPSPLPDGQSEDGWLIKYRTGTSTAGVDTLGTDWQKGADGYYYYTKVLEANRSDKDLSLLTETPAIFDYIVMPRNLTNGNGTHPYPITVTAEAVQAQGAWGKKWDEVRAEHDPVQIAAWFTTCGMPTSP